MYYLFAKFGLLLMLLQFSYSATISFNINFILYFIEAV